MTAAFGKCVRCKREALLYPVATTDGEEIVVCFDCKYFMLQLQKFLIRLEFLPWRK